MITIGGCLFFRCQWSSHAWLGELRDFYASSCPVAGIAQLNLVRDLVKGLYRCRQILHFESNNVALTDYGLRWELSKVVRMYGDFSSREVTPQERFRQLAIEHLMDTGGHKLTRICRHTATHKELSRLFDGVEKMHILDPSPISSDHDKYSDLTREP